MNKSLLERAPADLKIQWQGGLAERWTIRVEATIVGPDEAEAVREIIHLLSLASDPNEEPSPLALSDGEARGPQPPAQIRTGEST